MTVYYLLVVMYCYSQQFGPFDKYGLQERDEQQDDYDETRTPPKATETPTEMTTPDDLSPSNKLPNITQQDIWDAIFPPATP